MINAYIKKKDLNLTLYLKVLEKEEKAKPKVRRKEIKIRAEIRERLKVNEIKSCFFLNKIDKLLPRLTKKKELKIKSERRDITPDTTGIQRIIRDHYEQLHTNIWTPRRNRLIPRNLQPTKTE